MSKPDQTPAPPNVAPAAQDWVDPIVHIAGHYRIATSPEQLRTEARWTGAAEQLERLARSAGLILNRSKTDPSHISSPQLPLLAELKNGQVAVIETETADGFSVVFAGQGGLATPVSQTELTAQLKQLFVLRPASNVPDRRIDDYIAPWRPDWLRKIILSDMRPYRAIMMASLITNVLALAGILFSMQVYDRVVPGQSMPTLYVLFGGVMVATLFAFLIKLTRTVISDTTGKAADLRISDRVFGHALRVRSMHRPRATGTFIAQIRELEHVREIMSSTTVAAMADVPFFLLFCVLFYYIAGPLLWIPLVAALLLIIPGILAQSRLRRLAEENMRESALRGAMLVEAVQGLDDIKALQAETRFQNQWNHYNEVTADSSMKLRDLVGRLTNWAQTVQGAVFTVVVFFGAPLVMAGEMSTGVLVAASMLSSRMVAPLASVTQIINRWQQAKVGRKALDRLMQLPVDNPDTARRIHLPAITGAFQLTKTVFGHDTETPVLMVSDLKIAPGERVAILGRNGSGKSTLLAGLSGLLEPMGGEIRIDNITMGLVDPADLRRDIGYMSQTTRLFHGTLRENLTLGAPLARDDEILAILTQLDLVDFVRKRPDGLDTMVQEGGLGLSGGQRQGLMLSRLLLRRPRVLLLDEPTAALDEVAESAVIDTLAALDRDTSVIIATHRPALMRMVNRLIVINNGAVLMDGPKDKVLAQLRNAAVKT